MSITTLKSSDILSLVEDATNLGLSERVNIEDLNKTYGTKSNIFLVKQESDQFVFKLASAREIQGETHGTSMVSKFLCVPKIYKYHINGNKSWLLREYIPGRLMADNIRDLESKRKISLIQSIEKEKEKQLLEMYRKTKKRVSFYDYLSLRANDLFYKRISGKRYKSFYGLSKSSIHKYTEKEITLNGRIFPHTIQENVSLILSKYDKPRVDSVIGYLGHGDAHHGNILINDSNKIWFYDNEYVGTMPAYMELSKPYYNDFLGVLFFHFHDILLGHFSVTGVEESKSELKIKIKSKNKISHRIDVTNIKLAVRREILKNGQDFLTLNDYLFMSHILNRNPNNYPEEVRLLFIAFAMIITDFNPMFPESIYSYF